MLAVLYAYYMRLKLFTYNVENRSFMI